METSASPASPIEIDFVSGDVFPARPQGSGPARASARSRRKECYHCGSRASRRAVYCSSCGREVDAALSRNQLMPYIIGGVIFFALLALAVLWLGQSLPNNSYFGAARVDLYHCMAALSPLAKSTIG